MSFQDLVSASQKYFPDLKIKYKNESGFMKFLGALSFFNPGFMTEYTTTIGSTVYFPSREYVSSMASTSYMLLLHELVHRYDEKKLGKIVFTLSYLVPQILLPFTALFFLLSWKIAIPVMVLFASPLPAYWRMQYEKRAYMTSLYASQKIPQSINGTLESAATYYQHFFKDSTYYFMWPFSLKNDFDQAAQKIRAGQKPFQDGALFEMVDELLTHCS